jgi:hypothetical protein
MPPSMKPLRLSVPPQDIVVSSSGRTRAAGPRVNGSRTGEAGEYAGRVTEGTSPRGDAVDCRLRTKHLVC